MSLVRQVGEPSSTLSLCHSVMEGVGNVCLRPHVVEVEAGFKISRTSKLS